MSDAPAIRKKTLTVALMDGPYVSNNPTTAFRIVDAALRKGYNVNVFAYESAVELSIARQQPHQNPVKQRTVEEADHPTTKRLVENLFDSSRRNGAKLDWIACGLCVDERGSFDQIEGVRRGGPGDFLDWARQSDQTLVIATK